MKRIILYAFSIVTFMVAGCKQSNQPAENPIAPRDASGVITISTANLREEPFFRAEMGIQALMGEEVKIVAETKDWLQVTTYSDYKAWVRKAAVECRPESISAWNDAEKWIVTARHAILRDAPNANGAIVNELHMGDVVALQQPSNDDYVSIFLPNGTAAYALKSEICNSSEYFANVDKTGEAIVADALRFRGIPYLWGGNSVSGMDCSGLTYLIFRMHGILLPRNASQQVKCGEEILTDGTDLVTLLQPADLLFFEENGRVSHVGIYIGNGDFIHASASFAQVEISSLLKESAKYHPVAEHLVNVRRII